MLLALSAVALAALAAPLAAQAITVEFTLQPACAPQTFTVPAGVISITVGAGSYSFLDRRAPKGTSVRYWIQEVAVDGSRIWYGPARVPRAR